jgi:hypothetical protein
MTTDTAHDLARDLERISGELVRAFKASEGKSEQVRAHLFRAVNAVDNAIDDLTGMND